MPDFTYTIFIGKPPAEVWAALTRKELIDHYHLAPLLVLQPRVGGKIAFGISEAPAITGEVVTWEEERCFAHTFALFATGAETRLTYMIEPVGDHMCRLDLTHAGFAATQAMQEITGGWPVVASSLKTLLETGGPLPWPQDEHQHGH